ncbi:NucA/NucB deoxyribonuclease domain-containing protein [Streptomyces sp. DSM 40750]|uniref:NucA/NucB deoxyribonuclease domain-containing protein n=1 Tax=Streptomyces sp. DSM 40750 TaxID=2801030 RepID=UPI00214B1181|nr:NucA/NucB deoxyribonuclease domain-containing protein [Streptomyces sp. DSM 40750]UUU22301.1 NucA/NucB deoxyribonuclease domain-containing protein [Streptomyces sp. DSM 40750]
MGIGLLITAAAPSATAAQTGAGDASAGQLRVTIGSAKAKTGAVAGPMANATCTINRITVNRYSSCEWVTVHVDVIRVVNGRPVIEGTADFSAKHQMTLKANSANWSEKFTLSKAKTTGKGKGVHVRIGATSGGGTKATVKFPQGRTLDSVGNGTVGYKSAAIAPKKIKPKAKTTYKYTFTKAGYSPGGVSYASATYRCDNYYGSKRTNRSGCAFPEAPTAVSMVGLARIDEGIRKLRARGGHYGDPNGGKPLHWMINKDQENDNRTAVCPRKAPADMQRVGRTSCDEYPFASTREGGTHLPANQREITWVKVQENKSQGGRITAWRGKMHVMHGDPFYVVTS